METKQETQIPCVKCRSYNAKLGKFSCKPHVCKELSAWLLKCVPELAPDPAETGLQPQMVAIPYVV
ncbi:MAG: hypothetical protein ABSF44_03900 [Candidatus Bathyarchaeia archaeon]